MKKHNNYLFVENPHFEGTISDTSDGYLKEYCGEERRIKLPHNNYTLLGVVDECINAPYAEEFSKDIVDKDEFGGYLDYEIEGNAYPSASDSFQTLARVLDLKPTDYILRDEESSKLWAKIRKNGK